MPLTGNPEHYLVNLLSKMIFPLSVEKDTQREIENCLLRDKIAFDREVFLPGLSKSEKPDFVIGDGIVIEVKIKGTKADIYRQCERYCRHPRVTSLILMTNKAMGFPEEIFGKPCYVIDMSKAWL